MKSELADFALKYRDVLQGFSLLATGTTGGTAISAFSAAGRWCQAVSSSPGGASQFVL